MKPRILSLLLLLYALLIPQAYAEISEDLQDEEVFSQQELDQMLAPIALYPDALLSQVLMAATYPAEVAEAARWSREHPDLMGDAAVNAASQQDWDPSVISLTAFPQVLAEMDKNAEWTEELGDAFLIQQAQVMDTVQNLRSQAQAAGNLQSDDRIRVLQQDQTIVIEQAAPQVVYVPYYNPTVVYGPWWWDAYPPMYWDPWPGYYSGYRPGFYWGSGIPVGFSFFYSSFDWHRHYINVHDRYWRRYHHDRQHVAGSHRPSSPPRKWQHNPQHRRDVPYSVETQRRLTGMYLPEGVTGTRPQTGLNGIKRNTTARALQAAPSQQITVAPTLIPGRDDARATQGPTRAQNLDGYRLRRDLSRQSNPAQRGMYIPRQANPATAQSGMNLPRQALPPSQTGIRRQETLGVSPGVRGSSVRNPRTPSYERQQALPNNRGMNLPRQAMPSVRSSPSPQSGLRVNPQLGARGGQGNQGSSGGGGQYRR